MAKAIKQSMIINMISKQHLSSVVKGYGISRLVLDKCDFIYQIPMLGHVNSLNASVATGIILSTIRARQTYL